MSRPESKITLIARMLMIKDGMMSTIGEKFIRGNLAIQQSKMSVEDLRKAKRRFRKAWRKADKTKHLRFVDNDLINLRIKQDRAIQVNQYYIQKAKKLLKKKVNVS